MGECPVECVAGAVWLPRLLASGTEFGLMEGWTESSCPLLVASYCQLSLPPSAADTWFDPCQPIDWLPVRVSAWVSAEPISAERTPRAPGVPCLGQRSMRVPGASGVHKEESIKGSDTEATVA